MPDYYIRMAGEMLVVRAESPWHALRKVLNSTIGVSKHAKAVCDKVAIGKRATISIRDITPAADFHPAKDLKP